MKSEQTTVNPLRRGEWTYDKLSSFTVVVDGKKRKKEDVCIN